jgi:hypothetical protein
MLNKLSIRHEDVCRSEYIDPHFLDIGSSWSGQLHAPAVLPPGKEPRRFGGPQSQSGQFGEEKILEPTGTRTPTPQSSNSCRYTDDANPALFFKRVEFNNLRLQQYFFNRGFSLFFVILHIRGF